MVVPRLRWWTVPPVLDSARCPRGSGLTHFHEHLAQEPRPVVGRRPTLRAHVV